MKTRSIALALVVGLLANVVGFAVDNSAVNRGQTSRLVTMLPASDGVAVFESRRFLSDALPRILAANQPLLSEVTAKVAEVQAKTGIDLRKFEQVAVGVAYKEVSATETDYDTVLLASGDINAAALVSIAKLGSDGTYREVKVGQNTIYVFTPKDVVNKATAKNANPGVATAANKAAGGFNKEIAIATVDRNTLAIGSVGRVRETLEGTTHISVELTSLLSSRVESVASFAGRIPPGTSRMLPLDNDEVGANVRSIQFMTGSVDVAAPGTSLHIMARTLTPESASKLKETLEGLQTIGGAILDNGKKPEQKIYARLIKNAQIGLHATDVTLDLMVPQSDIDTLVATIKLTK